MNGQKTWSLAAKSLGALLVLAVIGFGAGLYWHCTGRLELRGTVQPIWLEACAATQGRIGNVAARVGQRVKRGQILVGLGEEERQKTLIEARAQLTSLASMLPPRYRSASGLEQSREQSRERDGESLEQLHERRRGEEEAARLRLHEASDREAGAAVHYNRVAMLFARHEATESDRAAAGARLAAAEAEKARVKADFEAASLDRAASGNEIRRVKEAQTALGADNLPLDTRLDLYRQQQERVAAATLALEQTLVRSPADGTVTEVLAVAGQIAIPGAPLVLLDPDGTALMVAAVISKEDRQRLKTSMRCLARIDGEDADREGRITNLRPLHMTANGEAGAFRVEAAILTGSPTGKSATPNAADTAGLGAVLTVLLREPPLRADDDSGQSPVDAISALSN